MAQWLAEADLEPTFATFNQRRAEALSVGTDLFFTENHGRLAALAGHYRVPAIYSLRVYAVAGSLMSYDAIIRGL